jgi:hypothetical protein
VLGELVQTTAGKWITHPPPRCPNGHMLATGELLAEVILDPAAATVHTRIREGHADAARVAELAVRRFAAASLRLAAPG